SVWTNSVASRRRRCCPTPIRAPRHERPGHDRPRASRAWPPSHSTQRHVRHRRCTYRTIPGMATIGILGGGQLARMLALAGAPLGLRFLVVDSAEDACAGQVAPLKRADWRDFDALAEFARRIDVATFDFENVPADTARCLCERTVVFPNPRALATSQDRLAEKQLFGTIGLETPDYAVVDSLADLRDALA